MNAFRSLVLLAVFVTLTLMPSPSLAQPLPGQLPGIVAAGFGSASEPAQSATLQFLLGSDQFFGMGPPMMETIEEAPGTPEAAAPSMMESFSPPRLTEEDLSPIVEALVAAGASPDTIEMTVPVTSSYFGSGTETGEIEVTVDQPGGDQLSGLVSAVRDAAPASSLTVLHVGVEYEVADCAALLQQARDSAIADARERAEGLATSLGVALGELVQASETPYFGSPEAGSCAPEGTDTFYGPYGPGTYPEFDPESTEAKVSVQVTLTFGLGPAA